ncbi:MAG: ATP synthase F1 subunit gamma [Chloroflexi bacterium]|nr:ATP synthase F1 subunit gamma [Chloroflexota bacterium]
MANVRQIRRRIRSVQNTAKITNALQLVAASKMRRAQQRAMAARPYAERMRFVLSHLATQSADAEGQPMYQLLQSRGGGRTLLIHVSPNWGLAGGLPGNLNRLAGAFALEQGGPVAIVAVGKKGRDFFNRLRYQLVAEFVELGDYPTAADTLPIARIAMEEFLSGRMDRVFIVYADFISTAVQRPTVRQLLPVVPSGEHTLGAEVDHMEVARLKPKAEVEYIYEPSPRGVLEAILPRYVEMQVYEAVLENAASAQSARMVAMKNATDAAKDMIEGLTLAMNKARQEQITKELLDIVGGVAAMEG